MKKRRTSAFAPKIPAISTTGVVRISSTAVRVRLFVMVLLLALLVQFADGLRDLSVTTIAYLAALASVLALVLLSQMTSRSLWTASGLYVLVFSLFHFGLIVPYGLEISFRLDWQIFLTRWFFSPFIVDAALLSLLGLFATVIGVHVAFLIFKQDVPKTAINSISSQRVDTYLGRIGLLLLLVGITIWTVTQVQIGGFRSLFGSYQDYLEAIRGLPGIGYVYFLIVLGLPLLAASSSSSLRKLGYALFAVWTLIALPIGLRGEVLFPAVGALVVAVRKGFRPPLRLALVAFVGTLLVIAAVQQVRQVGLLNLPRTQVVLNPFDATIEMGGTLRPVVEVLEWRASGDEFIHGASYWAPVERFVLRLVPWANRLDAAADDRLMNVLVNKRVGPIGFSPIAEAYRNLGAYGVFLAMFATGLLLGWLDLLPVSPLHNAFLAVVYVPLLIQTRNDFTPVPAQWLIGCGVLLLVYLTARLQQRSPSRIPHALDQRKRLS